MDKLEIKSDAVYTTKEAAELLGISTQTVQKYIRNHKLEATLIGGKWYRITGYDLKLFIELCKKLRVIADSYKLKDGGWNARAWIVENLGDKLNVQPLEWEKEFNTKEAADEYARIQVHMYLVKKRGEASTYVEEKPQN